MDGPPALSLGLENASENLMKFKPIKREKSIISLSMLLRIIFNGLFIGAITFLQYKENFLSVELKEIKSAYFTLFIFVQLFNAFNCRIIGKESVFKYFFNNKIMLFTFFITILFHFLIVTFFYGFFEIYPMSFISWLKVFLTSVSVMLISETYKLIYRKIKSINKKADKSID